MRWRGRRRWRSAARAKYCSPAWTVTAPSPALTWPSGGVGNLDHLADGVQQGGADAVLAASIFHYGEYTVGQAKQRMAERGIPVRL